MELIELKRAVKKTPSVKKSTIKSSPVPDETKFMAAVEKARKTGRWFAAVFYIEDRKIFMERIAVDFPKQDYDPAIAMLSENIKPLK